jgi:hypothetical protein
LTRRAAAHLLAHLDEPADGIDADDGELRALIAELALRATREPAAPATLEVEALQLERDHLDREIAAAQANGGVSVSVLAARRDEVARDLARALERAASERGEPQP